ncbi:MAG TPA: MAPEG family protein [Caulobacteraceae bacterium]
MPNESPLFHSILTPALALIAWSLVMLVWLYVLRIPAIQKAGITPDAARAPGALDSLPDRVRWSADNYNHLMEQPTLFYALIFYTYLAGQQDHWNIVIAWTYVALRVVHSLIQATVNAVMVRFSVFVLSSLVLAALAVRDVIALFA